MILLYVTAVCAVEKNGFVLDGALVPAQQIFKGGPAKDGIPSIDNPEFIEADDAGFLQADERILGIVINGAARAYPVSILNWHEIVNDSIDDTYFAITYCPLCGTGMAFNSDVNGQTLSFGVSGLLYNSDVLLYDRKSQSLWSQILGKAITGEYKGEELTLLPLSHTTWSDWKHRHPATLVLSRNTGYSRDYDREPYQGYASSRKLHFPVANSAPARYHPKEWVLGLAVGETYKAYPFIELNKHDKNSFADLVNGKTYIVNWNTEAQSGFITDKEGVRIATIQAYWFAWYAFHPDTLVFRASDTE